MDLSTLAAHSEVVTGPKSLTFAATSRLAGSVHVVHTQHLHP